MEETSTLTADFESYLKYELRRSPHTVRAYLSDLTAFSGWLGNRSADSPPQSGIADHALLQAGIADIRKWLAALARKGNSPMSLRRRLQSLRCFYRFLCRTKGLHANPAKDVSSVKTPRKLPQFIAAQEMEELLGRLSDEIEDMAGAKREKEKEKKEKMAEKVRDRLIIELLYATGMRRSELLAINDNDIDFGKAEVKVVGKRSKHRMLPLAPELLERISQWQNLRDTCWPGLSRPLPLLATPSGRMSQSTLYRIVGRSLSETNAGKKSPHTLRHTFATAMLNDGAPLADVKEFLGHSTLSTTQIYTHVSFADLMKAYDNAHPRADKNKD